MEVTVILLLRELVLVVIVLVYQWGVTFVEPGNSITNYKMSAERIILVPSFVITKP
jgi:hypothetical protein